MRHVLLLAVVCYLSAGFAYASVLPPSIYVATFPAWNTEEPGGGLAYPPYLVDQSGGDLPDSGSVWVDAGDGLGRMTPIDPLPYFSTGFYNLPPGENSHTYTLTASATNDGGTGTATGQVTVFRAPLVVLKYSVGSGPMQMATRGQTLSVSPGTALTLSIADSIGYIDDYQMSNVTTRFFSSSSSAVFSGDSQYIYGNWAFVLTNDVPGGSSGSMFSITVVPTPEPTTLGLLALGVLALRRRK